MEIKEIIEFLRKNKNFLRKNFAVKEIGIFGSYSKSQQKNDSDIDVYVEFIIEEVTFDKYLSLIDYLEKNFGKKLI